jgi:hypothetical protein
MSLNVLQAMYPRYGLMTSYSLFAIKTDAASCLEELVEHFRNLMALRKGLN